MKNLSEIWNNLTPKERRAQLNLKNCLEVFTPWEELSARQKERLENRARIAGKFSAAPSSPSQVR